MTRFIGATPSPHECGRHEPKPRHHPVYTHAGGALDFAKKCERMEHLFGEICRSFAAAVGPDFLGRFDAFEEEARKANLTAVHMKDLFEAACQQLDELSPTGSLPAYRLLRPIMMDVFLRLSYEKPYRRNGA